VFAGEEDRANVTATFPVVEVPFETVAGVALDPVWLVSEALPLPAHPARNRTTPATTATRAP